MLSWFIFENGIDISTFERRWEFWRKCLMEITLGWFLSLKTAYRVGSLFIFQWKSSSTLYLGISRFLTILEKKLIKAIWYFCIIGNQVFVFSQSNFFSRFSFLWKKRFNTPRSNRPGVWNSRSGWKKYQKLIVGGWGGVAVKLLFFLFRTMKTTVLRTFVYTVKVKQKQK